MDRSEHLASILAEWRARRDEGQSLAPEEVVRRHPELASELRDRFAAIELVDERFGVYAAIPSRIGEFRILREIGRGGMGIVYEAEQPSMRRRVALKVLLPTIVSSPKAIERFKREAQAAGSLKHTNIVAIHQLGQEGGVWFSAMELVQGRPLSAVIEDLRKARRAPRETADSRALTGSRSGSHAYYLRAAEMFASVAEALQVAHDHGVIHRDIKPANLLLDAEGELQIVDFGLARLDDGSGMTITGDFMGTPSYMSPEQTLGTTAVDARTDVYALGASLYETIALRPPFIAPTVGALLQKILRQDPPSPRNQDRGLPRDLETIVLKALEKEPSRRFQSAGEMAEELRRFSLGSTIRARPIGPLGRALRVVKRHRVRSALAAAVVVATIAASIAVGVARHESEERHRLEYSGLCRAADLAAVREWGVHESELVEMEQAGLSRDLYTQAIAHSPRQWAAYLGRAFSRIGNTDEAIEDVAAAQARGLPERTAHLARAFLYSEGHLKPRFPKRAARELALARSLPETSQLDAYLEGRALHGLRRWKEAEQVLSRGLEQGHGDQGPIRWLALYRRALTRERLADWAGALQDFSAARELVGDVSLDTRTRIASYWWRLGQEDRASREFNHVLAEAVDTGIGEESWWGIAAGALQSGETPWFDRVSKTALEAHPDSSLLLGVRFDVLLDRLGKREAALALLDAAGDGPRADFLLHANRARVLHTLRRDDEALVSIAKAIALTKKRPKLYVTQAASLSALGRHDEAMNSVEAALAIDPMSSPALTQKAVIQFSRGEIDAALSTSALAIETARSDTVAWARFVRARALHRKGDLDGALEESERSIKADDNKSDAHWARGEILRARHEPNAALKAFERAIELDPLHEPALQARALVLGNDLRRTEEALAAWQALVALPHLKGSPDGHLFIGNMHHTRGDWAEAVASFDLVLEAGDSDGIDRAFVMSSRATCLAKLERFEEAVEAASAAVELSPNHPGVLTNAAAAYQDAQQLEQARPLLEKALALAPDLHVARFNLAQVLYDLGDGDGALQAIVAYVDAIPADPAGWYERGRVLNDLLDRPEDAILEFLRALKLGADPFASNFLLGNAYFNAGEARKAIASYDKALVINPGFRYAAINRAFLVAFMGDEREVRQALQVFERAVADEADPVTLGMYARCLAASPHEALRDPRKAEALVRRAQQVTQNDADLLNTLGVALAADGKWQASLVQLEAAAKARGGGNGVDWIYLSLAHVHLGHMEQARILRSKAVVWIEENAPKDAEMKRVRTLLAKLLH